MNNADVHAQGMGDAPDCYVDAEIIWWNWNHGKNNGKRALFYVF